METARALIPTLELVCVILAVVAVGMNTRIGTAVGIVRKPAAALRGLGAMFLVLPLLTLAITWLLPLDPIVRTALLAIAAAPAAPLIASREKEASPTLEYVIGLEVASCVAAVVAAAGGPPTAPDGWSHQSFASLEEHRAALTRVRPDLAWTSRQLAAGRLFGSVLHFRDHRYAITCTEAHGSFEMVGPVSTEHLVLTMSLVCPTPGLQWMRTVLAGMVAVIQPGEAVDSINRNDVSFAVMDIPHDELLRQAALEGVRLPAGRLNRSAIVPGSIDEARTAQIAWLVSQRLL